MAAAPCACSQTTARDRQRTSRRSVRPEDQNLRERTDRRWHPPARNRLAGPSAHSAAPAPASGPTRRCQTHGLTVRPLARTRSRWHRCRSQRQRRARRLSVWHDRSRGPRPVRERCPAPPAAPPSADRPDRSSRRPGRRFARGLWGCAWLRSFSALEAQFWRNSPPSLLRNFGETAFALYAPAGLPSRSAKREGW